jgi:hypothetical protein
MCDLSASLLAVQEEQPKHVCEPHERLVSLGEVLNCWMVWVLEE